MGFISVPLIFTRTNLGELELANRVVVPPMCTWFADPETNEINDLHLVHYGALAMGGPGLIIFEGTSVEKSGCIAPNDCGLWNDAQMEGLKRITKLVHDLGCSKIGIQLAHAGRKALTKKINHPAPTPTTAAIRRTNTAVPVAEKGDVLTNTYCSVSAEDHGGLPPCVSSSSVPYDVGWRVPLEMLDDMFAHVRNLFVHAAQRAVAAGFDLIEIHNAHGYLLNQFTSPLVNKRTDEYGGSLENRCRFSLEVLADIRAAVPAHIPISVRISAVDWVEEGGWSIDDSIYFVRKLVEYGADIVHVSSGGVAPNQKIGCAWGYQIELSRQLKAAISNLKTIAVGGVTLVEDANDILNAGDADLVAVGREHLRDPYWTRHQAEALGLPHWYPAYQILAYRKKPA